MTGNVRVVIHPMQHKHTVAVHIPALAQRVIRGYLLSTNVRMFDGSQMIL